MYDHMNNSVYYFLYVLPDIKLDLWRKVLTVYTTQFRQHRQHIPHDTLQIGPTDIASDRAGRTLALRLPSSCRLSRVDRPRTTSQEAGEEQRYLRDWCIRAWW
jgi:hypothetical protein